MRRWLVCSVLVCAACDDCKKSSPPEVATPADVAAAKIKVDALDAARRAALATAKDTVAGRNDLGVCPVELGTFGVGNAKDITGAKKAWGGYDVPRWTAGRGDDFLANFPDELCAIERLGIAYADEVGTKPGPRGFQMASVARDTSPSKWQVDDLLKVEKSFDFELVIDDEIPPKVVSDSTFAPGVIRARFYVWDNEKSAIVCAARIVAESSDTMSATGTNQAQVDLEMKSGLVSDLREQALDKVKGNLFVAGPPRWAGTPDGGKD